MSFFKKLGETMKDTASTIGAKSMDMVETGKLKLQKSQLEGNIKEKKTEIGDIIYKAQKQDDPQDSDRLKKLFAEIAELESQIAEIDLKLNKESQAASQHSNIPHNNTAEDEQTVNCTSCGQKLAQGAKFCNNCGAQQ